MEAFSAIYSDAGLFGIRAHTLGAGDDSVVESIAAQFKQLAAGVTEEECKRAVNAIKGRLLTSKDSQEGQLRAVINAVRSCSSICICLLLQLYSCESH